MHVFPTWIGSLLSIGLLCDAGLTATYTSTSVTLTDANNHVVLCGDRSAVTGLWTLALPAATATAAVVITEPQGKLADCVN